MVGKGGLTLYIVKDMCLYFREIWFFPKKRDWQKKHIAVDLDLLDDIIDGNV